MPIAKLTFYVLLFGLSVYVVRLKFCTGLQLIPTPLLWVNAISLAVFPTVISLVTMTKAIHYIGSTPTAILGALEPVTALFFGVLIFGEQLTPRIILGILMVNYCRNSNYRRKNIAEKKQDSVKAYWQIRSDFVSLPL